MANSIITTTGSYIPENIVPNIDFLHHEFYGTDGKRLEKTAPEIIRKFKEITCIEERRYVSDHLNTSDMAHIAAEKALEGIDRESLDYIIVGHNFGEVTAQNYMSDIIPTIAARVKNKLKIRNPYTVCLDIPFGCPGWLQGVIMADYFIKSGDAGKCLVIGAEALSRVTDPHDMDSMIYADGAAATLIEATDDSDTGILSHVTRSDTYAEAHLLRMGRSYNPELPDNKIFIKMDGHQIYKYAVKTVPLVVAQSLDKIGMTLSDVKKIFIHQANQKMDEAILARLFKLYQQKHIPESVMPMTIARLGNSSVATIPTMLDLVRREQLGAHRLNSGDLIVFASVGAGMNINSVTYRVP